MRLELTDDDAGSPAHGGDHIRTTRALLAGFLRRRQ